MSKESNKKKKSKNTKKKININIKNILNKIIYIIKKYYYVILLALPFILIDLFTRILGYKIHFYGIVKFVPILFTLSWIFFILGVSLFYKKKIGKTIYIIFFILSFIIYITNNIYYSMTGTFFDFNMLLLVGEGSEYFIDAIKNCNIWVYILIIPIILSFIIGLKYYPNREKTKLKNVIRIFFIFLILHFIIPFLLGTPNEELTWSTWRNPRNIYINFNDNNKSMMVSGIYEYTVRNFYITFIKAKKTTNEEELSFLSEEYSKEEIYETNKYTGKYKDNNLIIIQLEGIDDWLITEKDTPTLYKMMNNSINFTNHYSYYNGGGSTFNSEFAVNTGFITPLSYTQNAYTFNKNAFPYSLANLFKNQGYSVNAFHMNTSEYYSRGANYKNWGYDNYYGLIDLGTYKDDSYVLDRELILNETFKEKMFESEKFVDYIITFTNHMPFSVEKGNCRKLVTEDILKENNLEELPKDYVYPELTEENCSRRQAKETDYMIELLMQELETRSLLDNTTIVVFTDHYLYTLSDQSIFNNYKETNNNLINHTPFFIWTNNKDKKVVKEVTSQLNVLPTILNLFGIEYNQNYYIGNDALNPNYQGIVFFSDYSWYDGNVYVDGGIVTNNKEINEISLEDKNYYINYLIKKNDLTLKYNYFKQIKENKNKTI
ncbi:MAG: LTA synthase family protein [Bacilli bacterium]